MKKLLIGLMALAGLSACTQVKETLTVTVSNSLPIERQGEMVEIPMDKVVKELGLADTAQVVVWDKDGVEVPYQITYDDKLIFPASVAAESSNTYTLQIGNPENVSVKACGRVYPERMDDIAWENDLIGCRAYGPTLQKRGERGFGYDLFTKRSTTEPVLEEMYAMQNSPENWAKVNELRKTDPKAANELVQTFTYHVDHGYGMDCYAVGPTLGAGVAALMVDDAIVYPWCYKDYEILDNGPLRFTLKLEFHPLKVKEDTTVVETRIITLDTGSHLNKTVVSYSSLQESLPVVTGIVLHDTIGAVVTDAKNGYMTYVDPTTGPGQGKIFMGAAFPENVEDAKVVLFPEEEKRSRNNAYGHALAVSEYEPNGEYVYYWGFAWDQADIQTPEAWNEYMKDFAQKVRTPLKVRVD
ncbi:MAG: DUF4861 domain-containing protein [Bacteroidaceae bacterium]|nr:DUF4861 domain-containing protein [Bacteroidaceae bacterium]